VEFSVSTIIPAAMVAINLVAKGTYRTFSVYVILCGPPSRTLYYYTVCLPLEIIVVTESVLTLLIIVRLRKFEALKARAHGTWRGSSSSQSSVQQRSSRLQRRFLLLVIFFPLCLCTILTTVSVYSRLMTLIVRDYMGYARCLNSNTTIANGSSGHCSPTHQHYHSVTVAIIDLLVFNVISVVLVAYMLTPPAARSFWARIFEKLFRCACRGRGKREHVKLEDIASGEREESSSDLNSGDLG
jgi:hypothetical protein